MSRTKYILLNIIVNIAIVNILIIIIIIIIIIIAIAVTSAVVNVRRPGSLVVYIAAFMQVY